jgi:hypothetical protein
MVLVVVFALGVVGVGASAGPIDRAAVVARHNIKFVLGKAAEQHDTAAEPKQQTYWCVRLRDGIFAEDDVWLIRGL